MPTLYDFQVDAMRQIIDHQIEQLRLGTPNRSVLIGDDMGLGKTVEAINLDKIYRARHESQEGKLKTLVVTMTSVMGAWRKHYAEWMPDLNVVVIDRKNRDQFVKALKDDSVQVYICHWQVLRFIEAELRAVKWFHVIGDEIQNIKNRKAQQSYFFKRVPTAYKTGLSGTWTDNRPDDAWSVLNWLWPNRWTSYWKFFNYHVLQKKHTEGTCMADGCDGYHKRAFTEICGTHDAELIHRTMGKAYIRRTKEEVWQDMPEKTYEDREVDLDPKQRRTYDAMEKDMIAWVGENEDQPLPAPAVISQLVRLQQFAVAYGKMEVFYKKRSATDPRTGETKTWQEPYTKLVLDEPSSKLDAVIDIVEASSVQIVVFGQSKQALNLLEARLRKAKVSCRLLTGDVAQADRDQYIEDFQSGRVRVFLSTIKAGGVGITLTAASICLFLDRDWSPTKNKQAEDRLHRLGQKNAVLIITLVARRTIDAARNKKIELKWSWVKQVLDPEQRELENV
jgi:SNF2 family DNA or RNA helicase